DSLHSGQGASDSSNTKLDSKAFPACRLFARKRELAKNQNYARETSENCLNKPGFRASVLPRLCRWRRFIVAQDDFDSSISEREGLPAGLGIACHSTQSQTRRCGEQMDPSRTPLGFDMVQW